jgi:hypothetical protein
VAFDEPKATADRQRSSRSNDSGPSNDRFAVSGVAVAVLQKP